MTGISDPYDSNNYDKMIEDQKKRNKRTKKKTQAKKIDSAVTTKPVTIVIESDLTIAGTKVRINGQQIPCLSSINFSADVESGVRIDYSMNREIDLDREDDDDDNEDWGVF